MKSLFAMGYSQLSTVSSMVIMGWLRLDHEVRGIEGGEVGKFVVICG